MPMDDSERSPSDGGTFAGQQKFDRDDVSLGGEATFAGSSKRRAADVSLGDERTLGGGDAVGLDTVIDDIEVVDLASRYKTEGTLGRGGMGEVLLALDTRLDRKVAIKRILGEAARSKTAVSRFLTEAKSIAALNHPNIVQIYDYGRAEDGPFLIMEYVDGSSLLDRCRDGALPLEEAVNLACQLCDGLGKAHDLGIVHRDIKPANVLLTKDGLPKLTDFGLAKAEATDHQMTMTGAVLGTPDFMPPEQRKDAALVDARSDLWSLAATVYQMVTGRSPKIIRFDLLPAGLTDVLGKALEEAKEDRFQTARELRDALKASLVATAPASAELSAGQCPSCGMKNDSSRRFCRGCGESLEAPCLSCSKPMPMWEEICGQCGTKQGPLLEERRGDMAAQQAEAEGLLKDHDFERAEGIAVALRDESDPRFKQLVPWATTLLPRIATARDAQLAEAAARLAEANKHEASFDYPSAIAALELVPQILRKQSLAGHPGNISTALARLSGKQVEVARLESWVKNQIAARELSGLLPEVKKLRDLRPDRSDVQKLCAQLEERQQKLVAQRDDAVAMARSRLDAKDYESALAVLRKIDRTVETPQTEQMRATADATLRRLQSMIAMIRLAVADKRLDGLIPQVKDALSLKPDHPDLIKLLESLNARETKVGVGIDNLIANAAKAFVACTFDTAVTTLRRIPEDRRTRDITDRLDQAEYLSIAKSGVVAGFESVQNLPDLSKAEGVELAGIAARGRSYLAQLAAHGLSDSVIEQWCAKCEAAAEARLAVDRAYQWLTTLRHAIFHVRARLVDTLKPKTRLAPDFPERSPARSNATAIMAGAAALGISAASLIALGCFIVGVWQTKTITNSIGMQFVEIPQGKYYRKIKRTVLAQDNNDLFVRSIVNLEKPFWICRTEVTQAQWNAVMPTSPWSGQPETIDRPQQPATYITQSDAIVFCDRLTAMERKTGNISQIAEYRLPTENEWEYSCRAGTASTYYAGEDSGAVATYEWCRGAVRGEDSHHPMDVALKRPTRWGLYDAFGNVREICSDHVRGGCWTDPPEKCTTWRNTNASPDDGNSSTGFRVVLIGGE